jgi:hypothetical protein
MTYLYELRLADGSDVDTFKTSDATGRSETRYALKATCAAGSRRSSPWRGSQSSSTARPPACSRSNRVKRVTRPVALTPTHPHSFYAFGWAEARHSRRSVFAAR